MTRVFPIGPEEIYLYLDLLLPPHMQELPNLSAFLDAVGLQGIHEEDLEVCTRVQQGMHSKFAKRAPYSLLETHNRDLDDNGHGHGHGHRDAAELAAGSDPLDADSIPGVAEVPMLGWFAQGLLLVLMGDWACCFCIAAGDGYRPKISQQLWCWKNR